jgi:hypothetical protein
MKTISQFTGIDTIFECQNVGINCSRKSKKTNKQTKKKLNKTTKQNKQQQQQKTQKQKHKLSRYRKEKKKLWEKNILGNFTSKSLLNAVFFYNCKLFGLREVDEHRSDDCSI